MKYIKTVVILFMVLISISGCSKAPATPVISNVQTDFVTTPVEKTITLAVSTMESSQYIALIDQFHQANPTIKVRLATFDELLARGNADVNELAQVADVMTYFPQNTQPNNLLNLRPFLESTELSDDFWPGLLPATDEPLYGLPINVRYPLIFYSKRAFDEQQIPYPQNDWSLTQFVETAKQLTREENGEVVQWGYVPDQLRYSPLFTVQLERPLQTNGILRLTDPDVLAALEWSQALFRTHHVSPWLNYYAPISYKIESGIEGNPYELIASGKSAMWQQPHTLYIEDDNVGVVAIPHTADSYSADAWLQAIGISQGTQHPDAAWQLIQFLSQQPPIETTSSWVIPARRSVAEASNFWGTLPSALEEALLYAVEHTVASRLNVHSAEVALEILTMAIDNDRPVAELVETTSTVAPPTPTAQSLAIATVIPLSDTENATVINFMTGIINKQSEQAIADEFMRQHPSLIIELIERNDLHGSPPLIDQIIANNIDCFAGWGHTLPKETVTPLIPFFELDASLQPLDFYTQAIKNVTQDGEIYALPGTINVAYLQYNRTFFKEMGLPEPALDWTTDDFLMLMQQISQHDSETNRYGFVDPFNQMANQSRAMLNIPVGIYDSDIPEYNLSGAQTAIRWMVDLIHLYEVQFSFPQFGDDRTMQELGRMVNEGEVIFWPHSTQEIFRTFEIPIAVEIGAVPYPSVSGGLRFNTSNFGRSTAYYIAVESAQKEACWEWISYLSQQPTQAIEKGWMPAHINASRDPAYVDTVGLAIAEVYYAAIDTDSVVTNEDAPDWFTPINMWFGGAYQEASIEGDVDSAMDTLVEQYESYRECIALNNGFDEYALWTACAIEVDPALRGAFQ